MRKKVAIISRTKNRPLLLPRCIESVLKQTYPDWLHVIVNDGGDPTAVEGVVSRFRDRYQGRVQLIHNETTMGMQNASNIAIRASDSDYLAIHDDDDTWHGMFLEECVRYLEAAGPQATEQGVAVQSWWIMEEIDSWGTVVEISRKDYLPFESISLFKMAARNSFPPIAFLYRRKAHETIGYFDQTFNELGDYDFNLRFLRQYDIGAIPKRLAGYHWRHQSTGTSYGNTVTDGLISHRKTLVKMQNHYLRQDLAKQGMGLGFLLNVAGNLESQIGWLHGLGAKNDQSANTLNTIFRKILYYERLIDGWLTPWKGKTFPRRVYDHVSDWMAPATNGASARKAGNNHIHGSQLEERIRQARVVSLDVFDTALLRLVRRPTDVFLYIQSDVRRLLNRPSLGFVETRVAAEEESRRETHRSHGSSETSLDDIYGVLRRRLGCDEATAAQIKQLELQAERDLCYANPEFTQLAGHAIKGDRKLIFSSDMYLPAREITSLLERNGFHDAPLYLSSDLLLSKHEGGLFDHVLKNLDCKPAELLHIGDNAHSDVERPQGKGIGAHHWVRTPSQVPLVDQHTSYSGAWEGDLASSLYAGLVRRRRLSHPVEHAEGNAFWEMIGYEVMGPLHHAFLNWVVARSSSMGLKKLFFLARDGFQLIKAFDLFRRQFGLEMEAEYIFASRRLWNVPRLDGLDEENLAFLVSPNPCMRVRDFLSRVGIDPAPHEALARRLGFKGLDERVTEKTGIFMTEDYHQGMRRLIREFEAPILELARRERKILTSYFRDMGVLEDKVGMVDIGWHASSSRSLQLLLAMEGQPRRIPGFYFGTWSFAGRVMEAGCLFESFFMNLGQPQHRASIVMESVEMVESFFSAPHPTIVSIEKKNGKWEPAYGEPEIDATMDAKLEIVTRASFEFIRDALALWPKTQEIPPPFGYLETMLERLLRHPRKDEAAAFGGFSWRNTFGGSGPLRHLANPPSSWGRITRRHALQEAYNDSYWKRGFLAQLSPRAKQYVNP